MTALPLIILTGALAFTVSVLYYTGKKLLHTIGAIVE